MNEDAAASISESIQGMAEAFRELTEAMHLLDELQLDAAAYLALAGDDNAKGLKDAIIGMQVDCVDLEHGMRAFGWRLDDAKAAAEKRLRRTPNSGR